MSYEHWVANNRQERRAREIQPRMAILQMNSQLIRRQIVILLLGFSSGLPLALTSTALQAWFTIAGVSVTTIGWLTLIGQPYFYKFLWAPILDRWALPFLGARRSWILTTQILLMLTILAMTQYDPLHHAILLGLLALLIACFSATQDIAIDAYRTEILPEKERGLGAAIYVTGYRIAGIMSGGLALVLADLWGWHAAYTFMALLMGLGIVATALAVEPTLNIKKPRTLMAAVIAPWREFISRNQAWTLLILIVLYKLGDAFALSLSTTFLIRGLNFSLSDVGMVVKVVGMLATLIGALWGGIWMMRIGLYRALLYFGVLQAISNLMFMLLALIGKDYLLMVVTIFLENLCGGMGTAAFMALLMSLCDLRYTAAQFALLSALASVGRIFVGPFAGVMVTHLGWVTFYFSTFVIALPGVFLLWWLRNLVEAKPLPTSALHDLS